MRAPVVSLVLAMGCGVVADPELEARSVAHGPNLAAAAVPLERVECSMDHVAASGEILAYRRFVDESGRVTRIEERDYGLRFDRDALGRVTSVAGFARSAPDALFARTRFEHRERGFLLRSDAREIAYELDDAARIVAVRDGAASWSFGFDGERLVSGTGYGPERLAHDKPAWVHKTWSWRYDEAGFVVASEHAEVSEGRITSSCSLGFAHVATDEGVRVHGMGYRDANLLATCAYRFDAEGWLSRAECWDREGRARERVDIERRGEVLHLASRSGVSPWSSIALHRVLDRCGVVPRRDELARWLRPTLHDPREPRSGGWFPHPSVPRPATICTDGV